MKKFCLEISVLKKTKSKKMLLITKLGGAEVVGICNLHQNWLQFYKIEIKL